MAMTPFQTSNAQAAQMPSSMPQQTVGATFDQAVQQQQQQQAPQQDPTLPSTSTPGNVQLAQYRARRDAILGEAQQVAASKDPFAMDAGMSSVKEEQQQRTQQDVWLSSTSAAMKPVPVFNQDQHNNFMEHWKNDPAVKEIEEKGAWNVVDTMAEMVKRGDMTFDQAVQQLQSEGFVGQIDEIIERHHKDNEHSMLQHPAITGRGDSKRIAPPTRKGGKK